MKKILIPIAIIALCCVFAFPAQKILSRSSKKKPKWITKPPKNTKEYMYFVGSRTGAETLEDAKKSATQNAIGEIITFFGIRAKTEFEEKKGYYLTQVKDSIQAKGEAQITGSIIDNFYYEQLLDKQSGRQTCDYFVLLKYPVSEIKKEKERNRKFFYSS